MQDAEESGAEVVGLGPPGDSHVAGIQAQAEGMYGMVEAPALEVEAQMLGDEPSEFELALFRELALCRAIVDDDTAPGH